MDARDLELLLGHEVDEDRANFLIDLAIGLAESIVDPVPDSANAIILTAVARVYENPSGATTTEMVGPYQVTRQSNSLSFFTSAELRALRALAGRGGAFSINLLADYEDRFVESSSSSSSSSS